MDSNSPLNTVIGVCVSHFFENFPLQLTLTIAVSKHTAKRDIVAAPPITHIYTGTPKTHMAHTQVQVTQVTYPLPLH